MFLELNCQAVKLRPRRVFVFNRHAKHESPYTSSLHSKFFQVSALKRYSAQNKTEQGTQKAVGRKQEAEKQFRVLSWKPLRNLCVLCGSAVDVFEP